MSQEAKILGLRLTQHHCRQKLLPPEMAHLPSFYLHFKFHLKTKVFCDSRRSPAEQKPRERTIL